MSFPFYLICEPADPAKIAGLVKDQIIQMNKSKFE
jgi:hypothetical protein